MQVRKIVKWLGLGLLLLVLASATLQAIGHLPFIGQIAELGEFGDELFEALPLLGGGGLGFYFLNQRRKRNRGDSYIKTVAADVDEEPLEEKQPIMHIREEDI